MGLELSTVYFIIKSSRQSKKSKFSVNLAVSYGPFSTYNTKVDVYSVYMQVRIF